jgi:flagellar motility protein MotE (MotC chaperone)
MKRLKSFVLTLVAAIVVLIGAEVATVMVVGKEGLQRLPVVKELFTVVQAGEESAEPKDGRIDEIDAILAKLREREALIETGDDQLDQLRQLQSDNEVIEARNRQLFDRIRKLYPIIDEARAAALQALAKKYEKMTPEAAAGILDNLSDQECAELLVAMNDRASAKVLEALAQQGTSAAEQETNRKRATKISQLMRNTLSLSDEQASLFSPPQ